MKWITTSTVVGPQELTDIIPGNYNRCSLGFPEFDRVLGGGMVPGSVVLMAGEPGIGKSTLLLQTAQFIASRGTRVVYVTGEESPEQIKMRSDRLGFNSKGVLVLPETDVDEIIERLVELTPGIVYIDSIQTLSAPDVLSGPGTVSQVRECALRLLRWAKKTSTPLIMSGHMTKDGSLAGPRTLEHMVDAVLYLEGENFGGYRVLRGGKNRFGSTNEVGIFEMGDKGLDQVSDPSRVLVSQYQEGSVGAVLSPILEGTRSLMVEVQALTSPSTLPVPRRIANGADHNRLLMLTAVLVRKAGLALSSQDIIVNVTGGLTIKEPALDLAIAVAIASSLWNIPVVRGMVVLGEVGLGGELRKVSQLQRRIGEANRMGFGQCLIPGPPSSVKESPSNIRPVYASTITQAFSIGLPGKKSKY